jgi:hypothetical protein
MTTAGEVLNCLQDLGFELIPAPPSIRLRYSLGPEPPPEARPLIEALRAHKAEALAELSRRSTDGSHLKVRPPWDDAAEKGRLDDAFDWADAEPRRRGIAWPDAWEALPVELRAFMDEALDAIDAAWTRRDVVAHSAALEEFRRVVGIVLEVNQDLHL